MASRRANAAGFVLALASLCGDAEALAFCEDDAALPFCGVEEALAQDHHGEVMLCGKKRAITPAAPSDVYLQERQENNPISTYR